MDLNIHSFQLTTAILGRDIVFRHEKFAKNWNSALNQRGSNIITFYLILVKNLQWLLTIFSLR